MRQTEFSRGVDKVLYNMEYDFAIEFCDATPEEAHLAGLKKIGQVYDRVEASKNEVWIDVNTGKRVTYKGW